MDTVQNDVSFEEIKPKRVKKFFAPRIFAQAIKRHWKLLVILTVLMSFYMFAFVFTCSQMPDATSETVMTIIGAGFFGMMGIIFLIIYITSIGNKLVVTEIDKGSMSFALNMPITRLQIVMTKAIYYVLSIAFMIATVSIVGLVFAKSFSVPIDYAIYFKLVLGYFLYAFAIAGICFFASCWFNKVAHSMMISVGLPVVFILLNAVSTVDKSFNFLKYFSLNTLFDPMNIIANTNYVVQFVVMGLIGFVCFLVGITKFNTKDLPL